MVTKEANSTSARDTTRKCKCCNPRSHNRCRPKVNPVAASPLPELQNNKVSQCRREYSDQVQQHAAIKRDPKTLFNCLLTQATESLDTRQCLSKVNVLPVHQARNWSKDTLMVDRPHLVPLHFDKTDEARTLQSIYLHAEIIACFARASTGLYLNSYTNETQTPHELLKT